MNAVQPTTLPSSQPMKRSSTLVETNARPCDVAELGAIHTPFGSLVPRGKACERQAELDFGSQFAPIYLGRPVIGNEIQGPVTSKISYSCIRVDPNDPADVAIRKEVAFQAANNKARGVSVPCGQVHEMRDLVGPNSFLRVQAVMFSKPDEPTNALTARIKNTVEQGADEISLNPASSEFVAPDPVELHERLTACVAAAGKAPLKIGLDCDVLTPDQIQAAAKIAEDAGVKFIRIGSGVPQSLEFSMTPPPSGVDVAHLIAAATSKIGVEFAHGVESLEDCRDLAAALPGRRVGFETYPTAANHIAETEAQELRKLVRSEQIEMDIEMGSIPGVGAMNEREKLLRHFTKLVDEAHEAGKPVVYLSIPVRANDAATFDDNLRGHFEALQHIKAAGCEAVDPFDVEGTPILTSSGVSPRAIQELLMDAATGLWPQVLAQCDAIAHGDHWRFSGGGREEQMMADALNIPTWDGKSPIALRGQGGEKGSFIVSNL